MSSFLIITASCCAIKGNTFDGSCSSFTHIAPFSATAGFEVVIKRSTSASSCGSSTLTFTLAIAENSGLTAEFTAAFLSGITGIQPATINNSTAYIQRWLKSLKDDKKLLLTAASQAQRACDYILNINPITGEKAL